MQLKNIIQLPTILVLFVAVPVSSWLWFPRYTVLQVTMAMVMPFDHPTYKVNMNLGVQCNYGLPWNATEFAKPTYWDQRANDEAALNDTRFKRDISSGEFYTTLEELMQT